MTQERPPQWDGCDFVHRPEIRKRLSGPAPAGTDRCPVSGVTRFADRLHVRVEPRWPVIGRSPGRMLLAALQRMTGEDLGRIPQIGAAIMLQCNTPIAFSL